MRFGDPMVMAMKINVLWDIKPYNPADLYQLFEEAYYLRVQLQLSFSQDPIFDSSPGTNESNPHRHTIFL
jgi:hypothetical protein